MLQQQMQQQTPQQVPQQMAQQPQQGLGSMMPAQMAYGGIAGADGRRAYGIGSWFQEKIMDPIKKNPLVSAAAAALAVDQFGIPGTSVGGDKLTQKFLGDLLYGKEVDKQVGERARDIIRTRPESGGITGVMKKLAGIETAGGKSTLGQDFASGVARSIIPLAGGLTAGLFADKIDKPEEIGLDRGTGVGIQNVRKVANLLDQQQGAAAGLNFLPDVAARKFSPIEMAVAYGDTSTKPIETLADGGRTGYAKGS